MVCSGQCDITDGTMRQMAELMVSLGLKVSDFLCTEHSGPIKRDMSSSRIWGTTTSTLTLAGRRTPATLPGTWLLVRVLFLRLPSTFWADALGAEWQTLRDSRSAWPRSRPRSMRWECGSFMRDCGGFAEN